MPAKRLSMRRIRELLRLKFGGGDTSDRTIARQLGVARSTVQDYLARIEAAGCLGPWPRTLPTRFWSSGCLPGPGSRPVSGGAPNRSGRLWPVNSNGRASL